MPLQINYDGDLLPGGRLGTSFTYSNIVDFPTQFSHVKIVFGSAAWWGSVTGTVNYLRAFTGNTFNGIVVKNGSQYKVYGTQPNAYYSNSKTFSIGEHTQYDIENYVSGELFWQRFSALPDIADGYLSAGEIKVRRIGGADEVATVTRLKKDLSGISFYTSGGIIRVDRFREGGSTGVYEHLEITEDIHFKTVPDGIEVKSVLPWGTFSGIDTNVSIGTSDSRFDSGYFDALDVTNTLTVKELNLAGKPAYACRAWVNFNGATSPISIRGAGNVDSITDNGTGNYTINFTTNMPDTNYAVSGMGMEANGTYSGTTFQSAISFAGLSDIKIGSVRILNANIDQDNNEDGACITVAIFR